MQAKQRWLGILALGVVAAVLALRAPSSDEPKTQSAIRQQTRVTAENEAPLTLEKLQARKLREKPPADMFKGKSWYVPPPPPKPVKQPPPAPPQPEPPPPPPTAPPLPYAYMGSYQEPGGKLLIYLVKAGRILTVSPGDTLENTYQVEGMAGGYFTMTYIPLNIKQTLRTR